MKLDFSKFQSSFKSEEEFQADNDKGKNGRFFQPGLHELEIKSCDYATDKETGAVRYCSDARWVWLNVIFKGVSDEREIRHMLAVPLSGGEWYQASVDKNPTKLMYNKFREYCKAVGIDVTIENSKKVLNEYFTDPSVQVGARVKATIGFDAAHAVMVRKRDEEGGLLLKLVGKDGKDLSHPDGTLITAPNDEALKLHCMQNNIRYNGFSSIIKFEASDNPVAIKVKAVDGLFD